MLTSEQLDRLEIGTRNTGISMCATKNIVIYAMSMLGEGRITFLISPAFFGYMLQDKGFAIANGFAGNWPHDASPVHKVRWSGATFELHYDLPGNRTKDEMCYAYVDDDLEDAIKINHNGSAFSED